MLRDEGFSLLEMLFSLLLVTGVLMTLSTSLLPIYRYVVEEYKRSRLLQSIHFTVLGLKKDLKRAGFNGREEVDSVMISHHTDERPNSCMIVRYDLNRNGIIEPYYDNESEYFSYRLYQGALEHSRSHVSCLGAGWRKLIDAKAIYIEELEFNAVRRDVIKLKISAFLLADRSIRLTRVYIVHIKNA